MKRRDDIDAVETPTEAQALVDELKRFEKDDLPAKEVLYPKFCKAKIFCSNIPQYYGLPQYHFHKCWDGA